MQQISCETASTRFTSPKNTASCEVFDHFVHVSIFRRNFKFPLQYGGVSVCHYCTRLRRTCCKEFIFSWQEWVNSMQFAVDINLESSPRGQNARNRLKDSRGQSLRNLTQQPVPRPLSMKTTKVLAPPRVSETAPGPLLIEPILSRFIPTEPASTLKLSKSVALGCTGARGMNAICVRKIKIDGKLTKNGAEIIAAKRAIEKAKEDDVEDITIHTDNIYLFNCATKWIKGWKTKDWKNSSGEDVGNKKELLALDAAMEGSIAVSWVMAKGTCEIKEADKLSNEGARKKSK